MFSLNYKFIWLLEKIGRTDGRGAILNAAPREGHIINYASHTNSTLLEPIASIPLPLCFCMLSHLLCTIRYTPICISRDQRSEEEPMKPGLRDLLS